MNTDRLILAGVILIGIIGSCCQCCHTLTDEPRCSGADIEARLQGKLLQIDLKILADKVSKLEEELKVVRRKSSTRLSIDGGYCPDEMTSFRGSCYFSGSTEMTLSAATEFCATRGGRPVMVETSAEQEFITRYLSKYKTVNYWIGISDMSTEGVWRRLDDDRPIIYTAWGHTEPQNSGGNEDCAVLYHVRNFTWADVYCTSTAHALCEISQNE